MWFSILRRGIVSLCLLALSQVASADAADFCSRPIRVAMFEFGVLYTQGDGVDSRLLDVISRRTGCVFERVLMPRARIWAELKGDSLDMATAAIATPERQSFGYLLPYMTNRNLLLVRKDLPSIPSTLAELQASELRMGMVRGFRHEPAYDVVLAHMAAQGRVKEVADVPELLKFLERGMVDAVLSQPPVFRHYMDSRLIDNALVTKDLAPKDQSAVGNLILSRKSFTPEQARRWDRLMASMLADGTLYRIVRGFLPAREARDLLYAGARNPD